MPTRLRRGLRRTGKGLTWLLVAKVLLLALALGVLARALPWMEARPQLVQRWLTQKAGHPVVFAQLHGRWTRSGPLLTLRDLRIGDGVDAVRIGDAELLVAPYTGWMPGRSFTELRLRGLHLLLERDAAGRWQVGGLPGQTGRNDPLSALQRLGELQLIGGRLSIRAPTLGIQADVPRVDARVRVSEREVRVGASARMVRGGDPLQAVLRLQRQSGDGEVWIGARRIDLAQWSPLLWMAGVHIARGRGRGDTWLSLRQHRVVRVSTNSEFDALHVRGAALDAGAAPPETGFAHLRVQGNWRSDAQGWRVAVPVLRIRADDGSREQVLDGLQLGGGQQFSLRADRIDAGPLVSALALGDWFSPGLRRWLQQAKPRLLARDLRVTGARDRALHFSGEVRDAGFGVVGDAPGISGVSGRVEGDAQGVIFHPDAQATAIVDWPRGFGVQHRLRLDGQIVGWREGPGWRVEAPALRVDGGDYRAALRGGLWWEGDGSRPRINMAAALEPTSLTVAKRFWIRHHMSPKAVQWLDAAFLGGTLHDGRIVVAGDLDDWPFKHQQGRFDAGGRIVDGVLRFQPDWPVIDHMDAQASFVNNGFSVNGRGQLAGVVIDRIDAGLADYMDADLLIDAKGHGDTATMLALLRASPLQKTIGEAMAGLSTSGPADVRYAMRLPLRSARGPMSIDGGVTLHGATLGDARWDLRFDQAHGEASFDRHGFHAPQLQVRHKGQPAQLALRAGQGHVQDARQAFEADLQGQLDTRELLKRAPQVAWMLPRVAGSAPWTISVALPTGKRPDTLSRLRLTSTLVGTQLNLPAPLEKPASLALPTTVDVDLPLGKGEIAVRMGDRFHLRTRQIAGRTAAVGVLGAGSAALPTQAGMDITGRADSVDLIDWGTLLVGGDGSGEALALRRIDVLVDRLHLLGNRFPATRVRIAPSSGGKGVVLDGPALAGAVMIPDAPRGTIAGVLRRVVWNGVGGAAQGNAAAADPIDPAKVPPLSIDIASMAVADKELGRAQLRTRPTPVGLRIDSFTLDAPGQRLRANGNWSGRGAAMQTSLQATLESDDTGKLMDLLGARGQLNDGHGTANVQLRWPGGPQAFQPGGVQGNLTLALRDGRITRVESGAGKLLALLSVAQLPRRLTLDFRDLFEKGLSYDRIDGEIAFASGTARTEGIAIRSAAAEIDITGSADLRRSMLDQRVEVRPKAGNLLTVAGALAGGPVGAAIGAAANAVLSKPISKATAKRYRVTGPFTAPQVEEITRSTRPSHNPEPATP